VPSREVRGLHPWNLSSLASTFGGNDHGRWPVHHGALTPEVLSSKTRVLRTRGQRSGSGEKDCGRLLGKFRRSGQTSTRVSFRRSEGEQKGVT